MTDGTEGREWCGVRIGAPAVRALAGAGIGSLRELAARQRAEVGALHGMGPKGLRLLDEALATAGLGWAS
jgi:hypothetical protein